MKIQAFDAPQLSTRRFVHGGLYQLLVCMESDKMSHNIMQMLHNGLLLLLALLLLLVGGFTTSI